MKKIKSLFIILGTLISLLSLSEAIFPLMVNPTADDFLLGQQAAQPQPLLYKLYQYGALLISLLLIVSESKRILFQLKNNVLLLVFVGFIGMSCIWALDLAMSVFLVAKIVWAILFGFFLAVHFTDKEILLLLSLLLIGIIISSAFFSVFLPDLGTNIDGAWRGAYGDKNYFSLIMNIGCATMVIAFINLHRFKWFYLCAALAAALMIVLSESATGIITLIILVLTTLSLPLVRLNFPLFMAFSILFILSVALLFAFNGTLPQIDAFFALFGKKGDLTGRTDIWANSLRAIFTHPLLGHGAQDVFLGTRGQVTTEIFYAPDAGQEGAAAEALVPHNLYLTILLKYGIIGALFFALLAINAMRLAYDRFQRGTSEMRYWYVLFILIMAIFGTTLSIDKQPLLWTLLGITLASSFTRSKAPVLKPSLVE